MVTLDGCKTWVETPLTLDKWDHGVMEIEFCGNEKVAVTLTGSQSLALFQLDDHGRAQELWRSKIFGRFGNGSVLWPADPQIRYDAWHKLLWALSPENPAGNGSKIEAFGLSDGKVIKAVQPFWRQRGP